MRRIMLSLMIFCIMFLFTACIGEKKQDDENLYSKNRINITTNEVNPQVDSNNNTQEKSHNNNILIAYFTWADNVMVENLSEIDVDASTSASILAPGNVAQMASWIQQEIGGDLFSIKVKEKYSSDYDECLERAANEKAKNVHPELDEKVNNISNYDTVFLGYPNWWYTAPMAIFSFIEENDLARKKIILFCSHGTGGLSSSVQDISAELTDSVVEKNAIGIYREDIGDSQNKIKDWLKKIGY